MSYDTAPKIVIWEMTRACALACRHCRATASPYRDRRELTTKEAFALVDAVARCERPLFILTGGDPLMRPDIYEIVAYATKAGLRIAVSPSATGRLKPEALTRLYETGCSTVSISIDGPDAASHDGFRGVRGSFHRTILAVEAAHRAGLKVQINTTVSRYNMHWLHEIGALNTALATDAWSVFFLVPVGRATTAMVLDARETEDVFAQLYELSKAVTFPIKTTEAPHYRRYVAQQEHTPAECLRPGIGDGKGFIFISHIGEICPSGFFPKSAGNVRTDELIEVYRNDETLKSLRRPELLHGKCGVCEYAEACGGSRARAYAFTLDALAPEPTCAYIPVAMRAAAYA